MAWVLDCSVALAWGLPDERSAWAERFLTDLSASDALWVPSLWWYELSNGLTIASRRHRVADAEIERLVELYRALHTWCLGSAVIIYVPNFVGP